MPTPSTYVPKRLITPSQLTGTTATIYTVPAVTTTKVNEIILTNKNSSACTVTIYLVPISGSASDSNILVAGKSLPTDGSPLVYEFWQLYMNAGDTIQAKASLATQVAIHLTGVEES